MEWMILTSLAETLVMVVGSLVMGCLGIPLGVYLYHISSRGLRPHPLMYKLVGGGVNILRSIPYIILVIFLIPATRILVGTSIGTMASTIPLGVCAFLLIARETEDSLLTVPVERIDIGLALGATHFQILWKIVFFEAVPNIIKGLTTITVSLIGFSAMAGAIGGGGLGDLAIRYGYQRYNLSLITVIVLILIILVQGVQSLGENLSQKLDRP